MRTILLVAAALYSFSISACAARTAPEEAVAVAVPEDCAYMNIAPYSALEPLEIHGEGGVKARFEVEIADTWARHQQGLMCRVTLGETRGMLFEFPDVRPRAFWMKNTLIQLDIVYIRPDGTIASISQNARPLDTTPLPSAGAASGVLEIEGGLSARLGLKPGDRVVHSFFGGK